ncbi:hypothetical protein D3C76_1815110 [compost metagenome]
MKNGILHERLEDDLGQLAFVQFMGDLKHQGNSVAEAHILNPYICLYMLQLTLQRHILFSVTQAELIEHG